MPGCGMEGGAPYGPAACGGAGIPALGEGIGIPIILLIYYKLKKIRNSTAP